MADFTFIASESFSTDELVVKIKTLRETETGTIIAEVTKQSPRFEDVKKLLYAGADHVLVEEPKLRKEAEARFQDKVIASLPENAEKSVDKPEYPPFSSFKTNEQGLIPCIAQDANTGKVLMLAYMNEESYLKTLETGLMTYWSRSREKLWTKGEESGHLQHVVSLTIDCDRDTILAKVNQEGPACHTGNETCFFTPIVDNGRGETANPLTVLEDVYRVIEDRKLHPREGSYTNYLFDKGIDKILKKVGEECTEIVIAAKNPDKEEIKYEIADFLYHVMVLMAERGVSWQEIMQELSRRE